MPFSAGVASMNIVWTGAKDVNIQAASLPNWQQSYSQLSPGFFRGRVGVRGNSCFSVFLEHSNARTEQIVSSDIAVSFGVLLGNMDHALLDGKRVGQDDVMLIRRATPFHFVMPGNGWIAALQCNDSGICRSLDNVIGVPHSGIVPNQVIRSAELTRAIREIMFEELRSNRTLARDDPRQCERLEPLRMALSIAPRDEMASKDDMAVRGKWNITRRAKQLVEGQDGFLMAISDIAGVLGLSERTLEYAFSEVFAMSPKAYFTLVRLNGFRRDLQIETFRPGMVADLAVKWGFSHFGRLSEYYRKFYGETPRETVRLRSNTGPTSPSDGLRNDCSLISVKGM